MVFQAHGELLERNSKVIVVDFDTIAENPNVSGGCAITRLQASDRQ